MFRHSLMTWGEKFVERDRRRFPRVQDRRRQDRRRTPQEHHGGEEGRRGISLSLKESHLVKKNDSSQKWVSFLIAKKTLLVIKYPFESRHQHLSTTNCWAEPKKPPRNLVYQKCIRIRADKRNIKGILICESTKRKYLSVAIVNECK